MRYCRKCRCPICYIGGAWVVIDPSTTADGLSYCPPNPDAPKHGVHVPYPRKTDNPMEVPS